MAMMKKNREKRKKKGLSDNFVDGESAQAATPEPTDISSFQAPQEANMDDEFAIPEKKGKGGKQNKNQPAAKTAAGAADADADGEERGADGKVLTKAEKEKLKKEREKQRKKEQVSTTTHTHILDVCLQTLTLALSSRLGCEEEDRCTRCTRRESCRTRQSRYRGEARGCRTHN
jgi:hypothetical protein